MTKSKTIEVKMEKMIASTPAKVYGAWLNPKTKGTPWNVGERVILSLKVNGLWHWLVNSIPHYGRFTKMEKGRRVQYTWMSPYTEGLESIVTVTFKKKGEETLMTLVHSNLPNSSKGKAHIQGWTEFMDSFPKQFKTKSR